MNIKLLIGSLLILVGLSAIFDLPIFRVAFAFLLIYIGYRVISGKDDFVNPNKSQTTTENKIKRVVIFSPINQKVVTDNFQGGEITAIFGGGEVDLSQVKTKNSSVDLEVVAIFGGLKIIVPDNWLVKSEGVGIVGGYNNRSQLKSKESVNVTIKGAAIFGGVDIVS